MTSWEFVRLYPPWHLPSWLIDEAMRIHRSGASPPASRGKKVRRLVELLEERANAKVGVVVPCSAGKSLRAAYQLHTDGGKDRDEIQARLIARQPTDFIARIVGVRKGTIRAYETYFFTVRDRPAIEDLMLYTRLPAARRVTVSDIWRAAAVWLPSWELNILLAAARGRPQYGVPNELQLAEWLRLKIYTRLLQRHGRRVPPEIDDAMLAAFRSVAPQDAENVEAANSFEIILQKIHKLEKPCAADTTQSDEEFHEHCLNYVIPTIRQRIELMTSGPDERGVDYNADYVDNPIDKRMKELRRQRIDVGCALRRKQIELEKASDPSSRKALEAQVNELELHWWTKREQIRGIGHDLTRSRRMVTVRTTGGSRKLTERLRLLQSVLGEGVAHCDCWRMWLSRPSTSESEWCGLRDAASQRWRRWEATAIELLLRDLGDLVRRCRLYEAQFLPHMRNSFLGQRLRQIRKYLGVIASSSPAASAIARSFTVETYAEVAHWIRRALRAVRGKVPASLAGTLAPGYCSARLVLALYACELLTTAQDSLCLSPDLGARGSALKRVVQHLIDDSEWFETAKSQPHRALRRIDERRASLRTQIAEVDKELIDAQKPEGLLGYTWEEMSKTIDELPEMVARVVSQKSNELP